MLPRIHSGFVSHSSAWLASAASLRCRKATQVLHPSAGVASVSRCRRSGHPRGDRQGRSRTYSQPLSGNYFKLGWRSECNSSLLKPAQRAACHSNSPGCNYSEEGTPARPSTSAHFQKLKERLGDDRFHRFCRWYLFDADTALSAGAAIQLFDLGERRLALLGSPLIQALHDGGYITSGRRNPCRVDSH